LQAGFKALDVTEIMPYGAALIWLSKMIFSRSGLFLHEITLKQKELITESCEPQTT